MSRASLTRRAYLCSLGATTAALAGCPSNESGSEGTSPADSTTATPTAAEQTATATATETATPTPTATATATANGDASAAKRLVRDFYAAADSGDFETANSLIHPDSPQGTISDREQLVFERQEVTIRNLEVIEVTGERARIRTTLELARDGTKRESTTELELRTYDGAWRLYSSS